MTVAQEPSTSHTKGAAWPAFVVGLGLAVVNLWVFFLELTAITDAAYGGDVDPANADLYLPVGLSVVGHVFVTGLVLLAWKRSRRVGWGLVSGALVAVTSGFLVLWFVLQGIAS